MSLNLPYGFDNFVFSANPITTPATEATVIKICIANPR